MLTMLPCCLRSVSRIPVTILVILHINNDMPIVYGNDKFTDCSDVCNPVKGMQWSCDKYCPDYEFIPATTTHRATSEVVLDHVLAEGQEMSLVVYIGIGAIMVAFVIFLFVVCYKKRTWKCFKGCWKNKAKRSNGKAKHPTQEESQSHVTVYPGISQFDIENGQTTPLVQRGSHTSDMTYLGQSVGSRSDTVEADSGMFGDSVSARFVDVDNRSRAEDNDNVTGSSIFLPYQRQDTDMHGRDIVGEAEPIVTDTNTTPKQIRENACIATDHNTEVLESDQSSIGATKPSDVSPYPLLVDQMSSGV